jgi:hypothetical protein
LLGGINLKVHVNKQSYPTCLWGNTTHLFWKDPSPDHQLSSDNNIINTTTTTTTGNKEAGGAGAGAGGGTALNLKKKNSVGLGVMESSVTRDGKLKRNEVKAIALKHQPWKTNLK